MPAASCQVTPVKSSIYFSGQRISILELFMPSVYTCSVCVYTPFFVQRKAFTRDCVLDNTQCTSSTYSTYVLNQCDFA